MIRANIFIFLFALLFTGAGYASETVPVYNDPSPTPNNPTSVVPTFSGDTEHPETGHAWISIVFNDAPASEEAKHEAGHLKKELVGLSLDEKTKNILYKSKDKDVAVVCATFIKGEPPSPDKFETSSHCKFVAKTRIDKVDDGTQLKKQIFVVIDLVID